MIWPPPCWRPSRTWPPGWQFPGASPGGRRSHLSRPSEQGWNDIRSLAAYSFNRYLRLGGKTRPAMTLEDFIDLGGKLALPAVELTAYYFPKTTGEYLKEVKSRCTKLGLAVSGTAVGNDFCWKDPEK